VKVQLYHLTSGFWGTCDNEIARIGVIAHETGHFLGLPDLYDGSNGSGLGAYDLMGNSWGFDGDQKYAPMLSSWSKIKLGWVDPVPITHDGTYFLDPLHSNREVYVIEEKYAQNEYLLIENRQHTVSPYVFENKLPRPGLAIFHIDDDSSYGSEGHPHMEGWPENGQHYRVALLQADGDYHLERLPGLRGDFGDLFSEWGAHSIGPDGTSEGKQYPNTNSYGGSSIVTTGVHIKSIRTSQKTMSLEVSGLSPPPAQIDGQLTTTFVGGNYQAGNMFDLRATQDLTIDKIDIHTRETHMVSVVIYSRQGTFVGHESDFQDWQLHGITEVMGQGDSNPTPVDGFNPIHVTPDSPTGVYVTLQNGVMDYSSSGEVGDLFADDGKLSMTVGTGNRHSFQQFWRNRVFNGRFYYTLGTVTSGPTKAPTLQPTTSPTPYPLQTVSAPFRGGNGQSGVMFDIVAIDSLELVSIDINSESTSNEYTVEVWTIEGSYKDHSHSKDGWTGHGVVVTQGMGEGQPTVLSGFSPIHIEEGQTKGIYITDREGNMKYSSGVNGQGAILVGNENLHVLEGSGCRYPFGKSYTPRVVNANFHYKLASGLYSGVGSTESPSKAPTISPTANPTATRSDSDEKSITTTWESNNGQAGNMFNIQPWKTIMITSFDLHCEKTELVHLKIYMKEGTYIGFEASPASWGDPICETDVIGQGSGNPTPVPDGCFDPITADAFKEYSFYITLTTGDLRYTKINNDDEGDVFVENSDLTVFRGIGVRYEFGGIKGAGGVYRPRLWNGDIKYYVEDECHMKGEPCNVGSDCCVRHVCNDGVCDYMVDAVYF